MTMQLTSTAFDPDSTIPRRYTGDGDDVSPPLAWSGAPQAAQFALICDDPDAPTAEPFVHWVIYGIPGQSNALPQAVATNKQLDQPAGALQGINSFSTIGYRGPAPPRGHGLHHYHFKLYALDQALDLPGGADKKKLLAAMRGHIVAESELVGTYQR